MRHPRDITKTELLARRSQATPQPDQPVSVPFTSEAAALAVSDGERQIITSVDRGGFDPKRIPMIVSERASRLAAYQHRRLERMGVENQWRLWDAILNHSELQAIAGEIRTLQNGEGLEFTPRQDETPDETRDREFAELVFGEPDSPRKLLRHLAELELQTFFRGHMPAELVYGREDFHGHRQLDVVTGVRFLDRTRMTIYEGIDRNWRTVQADVIDPDRYAEQLEAGTLNPDSPPVINRTIEAGTDMAARLLMRTWPDVETADTFNGKPALLPVWRHWTSITHGEQQGDNMGERLANVPVEARYTGTAPNGYRDTKGVMRSAIQGMRENWGLITPAGWELIFHDTNTTSPHMFLQLEREYHIAQIRKSLVLQTISGGDEASSGTFGANAVVAKVLRKFAQILRQRLSRLVLDVLEPLLIANFYGSGRAPERLPQASIREDDQERIVEERQRKRDLVEAGALPAAALAIEEGIEFTEEQLDKMAEQTRGLVSRGLIPDPALGGLPAIPGAMPADDQQVDEKERPQVPGITIEKTAETFQKFAAGDLTRPEAEAILIDQIGLDAERVKIALDQREAAREDKPASPKPSGVDGSRVDKILEDLDDETMPHVDAARARTLLELEGVPDAKIEQLVGRAQPEPAAFLAERPWLTALARNLPQSIDHVAGLVARPGYDTSRQPPAAKSIKRTVSFAKVPEAERPHVVGRLMHWLDGQLREGLAEINSCALDVEDDLAARRELATSVQQAIGDVDQLAEIIG